MKKILFLPMNFLILGFLLFVPAQATETYTPEQVEAYLLGSWGHLNSQAAHEDYERYKRGFTNQCGRWPDITKPLPEKYRDNATGLALENSKTFNLAFGRYKNKFIIVSKFKEDNLEEMFDNTVVPKVQAVSIKSTAEPDKFAIGIVPGIFEDRVVQIISDDKFILMTHPESKGGAGASKTFRRCAR